MVASGCKSSSGSAVMSVGDELILGELVDSNRDFILRRLNQVGIPASMAMTVSDDLPDIVSGLSFLIQNGHDPIFLCGGLGGTHDDRTREGVARALNLPLERHSQCMEVLQERYQAGLNEQRSRMADLPRGAKLIHNPLGAPGFNVGPIFAFPGFPRMLKPMVESILDEYFEPNQSDLIEILFDCTEGVIATEVENFSRQWPGYRIGLYANSEPGVKQVRLRIRTIGSFTGEFRQVIRQLQQDLESKIPKIG